MTSMAMRRRRSTPTAGITWVSRSMRSWCANGRIASRKREARCILTNGEVRDPFAVFDTYDWRSVIENGIFKEGKHPWHLLNFPKRTQAAVIVHCHLTLLVMGLCTAFRLWQAQKAASAQTQTVPDASSALLGGEGTARWRKRLQEHNRDKVICC